MVTQQEGERDISLEQGSYQSELTLFDYQMIEDLQKKFPSESIDLDYRGGISNRYGLGLKERRYLRILEEYLELSDKTVRSDLDSVLTDFLIRRFIEWWVEYSNDSEVFKEVIGVGSGELPRKIVRRVFDYLVTE